MPTKKLADRPTAEARKPRKLKMLLLAGVGSLLLLGGGVGAGFYASHAFAPEGSSNDPNRPKLVQRSEANASPADAEEGESKEPPKKIGTVPVASDLVRVDPRKYDVTYIPLEQPFTANLANGGIIQVGLSFATYYDHRVVENLQRQTVPIRSAALTILAEQDPAILSTSRGKQEFQRQLTGAVNQVLRDKEGFGGIDNVYFTSLVIQ